MPYIVGTVYCPKQPDTPPRIPPRVNFVGSVTPKRGIINFCGDSTADAARMNLDEAKALVERMSQPGQPYYCPGAFFYPVPFPSFAVIDTNTCAPIMHDASRPFAVAKLRADDGGIAGIHGRYTTRAAAASAMSHL